MAQPPSVSPGRVDRTMASAVRGRGLLVLAAAAAILYAPSLRFCWAIDDWLQKLKLHLGVDPLGEPSRFMEMFHFTTGEAAHNQALMDTGFLPWWTWPGVKLSLWRPVTELTHRLDYALWPDAAVWMHAHSIAWAVAAVLLAAWLYRRTAPTLHAAGWAAVFFALEDARAMPTAWIANRNTLIALVFALLAMHAHHQWRKHGKPAWALAAAGAFLAALLSKESGLAITGYLAAYVLFLDPKGWRAAWWTLAPYAATVVLWRVAYGALDFGVSGSQTYIDPLRDPVRFLAAFPLRYPVLLAAQWFVPLADVHILIEQAPAAKAWVALACSGLAALALWVVWPVLRTSPTARFWGLGMLLALVPACTTFPTERLLAFGGIGAMGLLGETVAGRRRAAGSGRLRGALIALLVFIHLVLAPVLVPLRAEGFHKLAQGLTRAAQSVDLKPGDANKTLVVVNAPNILYVNYLPMLAELQGKPFPKQVRGLAGMNLVPVMVRVECVDAHTLRLQPEGGFPWLLARSNAHPFAPGDTVSVKGMTVTVESVDARGVPLSARFRFGLPLDSPALVWRRFNFPGQTFAHFTPPPPGEAVVLHPAS